MMRRAGRVHGINLGSLLLVVLLVGVGRRVEAQTSLAAYLDADTPASYKTYMQIQVPAWFGDIAEATRQLESAIGMAGDEQDALYNITCAAALCAQASAEKDRDQSKKFADQTFTDLGAGLRLNASNAAGQIVGTWAYGGPFQYLAGFLWSPTTPNSSVGSFFALQDQFGGDGNGYAESLGINNADQIVGFTTYADPQGGDGGSAVVDARPPGHLPQFNKKPLSTLEIRRYTPMRTTALQRTGS